MKLDLDTCVERLKALEQMLLDLSSERMRCKKARGAGFDRQDQKYSEIEIHYTAKGILMRQGNKNRRSLQDKYISDDQRSRILNAIDAEPEDMWELTHPA